MNEITAKILQRLKASHSYVSGQDMSREMDVSRAAISKHVQQLRDLGYTIKSVPRKGHLLRATVNQARTSEVQPLLATSDIGRHFIFQDEVSSTNRLAMGLAGEGAPSGTVVVAEQQSEGRGRMGRLWYSPRGANLYLSIVLRPKMPPNRVPELALVTAISLRESLQLQFPSVPFRIKWPNDIWVEHGKLSGILCEMAAELDRVKHVVVGIGINVNTKADDIPPELAGKATSIRMLTDTTASRPHLLAHFLNRFEQDYNVWQAAPDLAMYMDLWHEHCILAGRKIVIQQFDRTIEGIGRGIDRRGRLLVEQSDGNLLHVTSGDAHIARIGPQ
jgi:BirA family biotin operon repressor/biotin-[acetyl-CoA-carboxylase] ligase